MCFSRKKESRPTPPIGTTTADTRNIVDRILDPYATELHNHIDKTVRVIITPNPIKNLKQLNIAKIGGISFEIDGTYQKQELVILPGTKKNIIVDNRYFYLTAFILSGKKWKKLWLSRLFHASKNIHFIERHKQEAFFDIQEDGMKSTVI